jgi:hypothetical protein
MNCLAFCGLILSLWVPSARAQEFDELPDEFPEELSDGQAAIFVAPFVAKNREATGLAGMLPSFLEASLDNHPDLRVVHVEQAPQIHDMSAEMYLETCPPGQSVGCSFVVAENSGANFALAGTVRATASGSQVEIVIIDVAQSREVLGFQVELGQGDDERFAEGVAGVLVSVVRGEAGRVQDIRDLEVAPEADHTGAVSQLSRLTAEIGDVTTLEVRRSTTIQRPQLTEDDIAKRMETEGLKPWERVGLGPAEFMRWRNSGMDLPEWQNRHSGRQMQLIMRGGVGYGSGPVNAQYYGTYARDGADALAVTEVYAWQAQTTGTGLVSSLSAGFGVTPYLETGLQLGFASGRFEAEVQVNTVGNTAAPSNPKSHANGNMFFGPYVLAALLPGSNFRPIVGLGFLYWKGTGIEDKEKLPEALPLFSAPTLFAIEPRIGGEARISKTVDMFLHIPMTAVIGGASSQTRHQGAGCTFDDSNGVTQNCLDTSKKPPGLNPIGATVLLGIQVRLFGKRHNQAKYKDYDVDESEVD